ncbi:11764_t:CDS:2 [Gigaspora margarita]|uniref:11764_t:CDS:1 n=1 Tax=Gigaspora margarita TaxID=4874 RepID=A0ABM8VZA9_GIGMA|nr:11764_t:CDS:2 [Gigaspora margarita]
MKIEYNLKKLKLVQVRAAAAEKSLEKRNEYVLGESRKYDIGIPIGFEFNNYCVYQKYWIQYVQDYQTLAKGVNKIDSLLTITKNKQEFHHMTNKLKFN